MDATALFRLSYGLYVVGVKTPNGFGGSLVDAVAQVASGDPPALILSSMKTNYTNDLIKAELEFTISILAEDVDPFVIANFGFQSARTADKWRNVPHAIKDGLPVLEKAAAYLRCRVREAKELSTHTMFICEVVDAWNGGTEAKPLIFGDYRRTMKAAALEAFKAFKASGAGGKSAPARERWRCAVCGYMYEGDKPLEQLPEDWVCPICGFGKGKFEKA